MFDLGGVVFHVDFTKAFLHWAECARVPARVLASRYCVDVRYEQHERGQIEADAYFDSLREMLDIAISNEEFTAGWNSVFDDELPGLGELLSSLSTRIPIYAFSNTNFLHQAVWMERYAETLSSFREVFTSCDLGLRKPERTAFERVAAKMNVSLEEIMFFDDTRENVDGARICGMNAVHVRSVDDIEKSVETILS